MNKNIIVFVVLVFISCSSVKENSLSEKVPGRIISLAPSITEIIYALGAEDKLVGITNYCKYPAETAGKIRVGGFADINYEAIVNLKPDIVLLLPAHTDATVKLKKLGIKYSIFKQKSIRGIRDSILNISKLVGKKKEGLRIAKKFDSYINKSNNVPNKNLKKVMIIVSRTPGKIFNIFAAGRKTFYNDIIKLAGGINAAPESSIDYPMLNSESILGLNPDVIIEIFSPEDSLLDNSSIEILKKDWTPLNKVNAVKNNRIFYIIKDYAVIPGPRILKLIEDIKNILSDIKNNR